MIPISADHPVRLTPFVTWGIMGLCLIAFLWEWSLGGQMTAAINVLGFRPATLSGALTPPAGYRTVPAWATLFTSMFLHGGWLHIGGNMLYLWIFGNNVEDAMGHWRFTLFYLISGVAAALTLAAIDPDSAPGQIVSLLRAMIAGEAPDQEATYVFANVDMFADAKRFKKALGL